MFGAIFVYSGNMQKGNRINNVANYVVLWRHVEGGDHATTLEGVSRVYLSDYIRGLSEEAFILSVTMVDSVKRANGAGLNISNDFTTCLGCDDCESGECHV